jgi:hypothetical protein
MMQDFTVIEWRGGISVSRRHFSYIPPGYVLLRVYYAAWTGVEEAIRQRAILPRYGVVMGFSGVGRVVEASTGVDPAFSGKYVAPTVVEVYSQMGIDADGFLGEYTVVKSDALTVFDNNPNSLDSLALHASIAYDAITRIESSDYSRILVVGAGVSGLLLSLELAERGHSVDTYTLKYRKNICGLRLVNRVTPTDYDVVVLMTPMPLSWYFTSIKAPRTIFVHPAALPAYAFSFNGIVRFELLRGIRGLYWRKLIRKHAECLEEHIVNIDVGLVEPPFLGENTSFIYVLERK